MEGWEGGVGWWEGGLEREKLPVRHLHLQAFRQNETAKAFRKGRVD